MKNNSRLTMEMVEEVMMNWSIRFKEKSYSPEELTILAEDYYEDLLEEGFTKGLFERTVKLVRKRAEYFPSMKLLLSCREEAQALINREADEREAAKERALLMEPDPVYDNPQDQAYDGLRDVIFNGLRTGLSFQKAASFFKIIDEGQAKCAPVNEVAKILIDNGCSIAS